MSHPSDTAAHRADLPTALRDAAILPDDAEYEARRSVYSVPGSPAVVFPIVDVAGVQEALAFAAEHRELPLAVRSGGHSIAGASTNDGGVVIDLSGLRGVTVLDESARRIRVEPGTPSGALVAQLAEKGWAIPVPTFGDTAIGGVATAGGIGLLAREYGLTLDHVVGFEVILADGRLVRADAASEPELFWALRGTGATTGVVVAVEFIAIDLPEVVSATTTVAPSNLADVLFAWTQAAQNAPRAVTSAFLANRAKDDGSLRVTINTVWAGADGPEAQAALAPFLSVDPAAASDVQTVAYARTVFTPGFPHSGKRGAIFRNAFSPALDREGAEALAALLAHDEVTTVNLRGFGGATADASADATAFTIRDADYLVSVWGAVGTPVEFEELWTGVKGRLHGVYAGYTDQADSTVFSAAFPDSVRERLAAVQSSYDPTGLLARTLILA